jgi:hypothetical protein
LTYKKAIRLIIDILKDHKFILTKTAQKQAGYLALYATEGEISSLMHHELKAIIGHLPCKFEPGSMSDETFLTYMDRYAKLLLNENEEGGEINLGWLQKEARGEEIWKVFAGREV